jgi:anti-sigma regulatory factor (Ser/Thr protein kinase)
MDEQAAPTFTYTIPGRLEALRDFRSAFRRWLADIGIEQPAAEDVVLAAWEICANAVEHPRDADGSGVQVEAWASPGVLRIAVRDTGSWFHRSVERPNRGLGLRLARALVDRMSILSEQPGTEIVLWRSIGGRA